MRRENGAGGTRDSIRRISSWSSRFVEGTSGVRAIRAVSPRFKTVFLMIRRWEGVDDLSGHGRYAAAARIPLQKPTDMI